MTSLAGISIAAVLLLLLSAVLGLVASARGSISICYGAVALNGWIQVASDLTVWHDPYALPIAVPLAVLFTWLWWRKWRRKRRKAKEWIGAKSRALREALVRRLKERKIRGGIAPVPV